MKIRKFGLLALALMAFCSCQELDIKDDGVLVPLTVMEDETLPFIAVNGVRLHSETFGDPSDPMLVVIHGGPGADYRSQLNFKQLADDDMFVVFYDQRGSGLSERLEKSGFPSVQVYIDELDGVIAHYRQTTDQPVVLAGHSWGAMLATAYINQQPEVIAGMILAEPGGFTWEDTEAYISRSRQLKFFDEGVNDFVYQDQLITSNDHNTLDYKMILSTAAESATGDKTPPPYWRYGGICNIASIDLAINFPEQLDFTANLSAYTDKVLFAFSALNPAYGLEHAELVSGSLPNVELVEIPDTGHEIPEYGWSAYYPLIQNYLTEIL